MSAQRSSKNRWLTIYAGKTVSIPVTSSQCYNSNNSSRIQYCLDLKLWNEPCANKCQSFQSLTGEIGTLEEAESQNYDIDCLDMSRKIIHSQSRFYCEQYELPEPFCGECHFARYSASPAVELGL